jgi:hypothetical protein
VQLVEITSDWGYVGRFVWINSQETCANVHLPVDLGSLRLRLHVWGGFSLNGCIPKNMKVVTIR